MILDWTDKFVGLPPTRIWDGDDNEHFKVRTLDLKTGEMCKEILDERGNSQLDGYMGEIKVEYLTIARPIRLIVT